MNQTTRQPKSHLIIVITMLAALIVMKTVAATVVNLVDYFPPDFNSDFLVGREAYFYGPYQIAFSLHVISGPLSLVLGLLLVAKPMRIRWPKWHRRIGQLQVAVVVLIVAPSGCWMAFRAVGGAIAVSGFATLSLLTGWTAFSGYKAARSKNFRQHEAWMSRCFLLLVSAVVLRVIAGIFLVANVQSDWIYPTSAWISWLLPLGVYEVSRHRGDTRQ